MDKINLIKNLRSLGALDPSRICFFSLWSLYVRDKVFSRVLRDSISHYVGYQLVYLAFMGGFCITAPAQMPSWPSTSLPLPTRTRLGQPCIRPCFHSFFLAYFFYLSFVLHFPSVDPDIMLSPILDCIYPSAYPFLYLSPYPFL